MNASISKAGTVLRFTTCVLVIWLTCGAARGAAAAARTNAQQADERIRQPRSTFVIGISPFLNKSAKDEVYRGIVRLLVEDLPLGSNLAVYDAFELRSVTRVNIPNAEAFNSPKTRANQFASAVRDVKEFLARDHPAPNHSGWNFEGAVRLPQFYEFLADGLDRADSAVTLLLVGSPLYLDAKEPGFAMVDGYFPSDGHLQATREQSVYGFSGEAASLPHLLVHWAYFGDPWINDLHRERVARFWTLYWQLRASELATFSADLPTTLRGFSQGTPSRRVASKSWALDPRQQKIEMLRINRNVQVVDWLTGDSLPESAPSPPVIMVGPMKIGIRWTENIDLDLYATPRLGAETLFFQHPKSPEGYYYHDHRSSPGREFEFIEFESPVDIREVKAFVNFFAGSCSDGPRGEVRIEFDGRIYAANFSLQGVAGNRGRTGRDQQDFWTRIPVQDILQVAGATASGPGYATRQAGHRPDR
jgi:hypothetical protein